MPVGEPAPVISRLGTTPGSFWCQCCCGISVSMLVRGVLPAGAGQSRRVAVVAELHQVIDADAAVAVVVVVATARRCRTSRRPARSCCGSCRPSTSKSLPSGLQRKAMPSRYGWPLSTTVLPARVDERLPSLSCTACPVVADVPIQLAVGAEDEGVRRVVVLGHARLAEQTSLSCRPCRRRLRR